MDEEHIKDGTQDAGVGEWVTHEPQVDDILLTSNV